MKRKEEKDVFVMGRKVVNENVNVQEVTNISEARWVIVCLQARIGSLISELEEANRRTLS